MTTISKLMDLGGRHALITGAAGGLGTVMAETFAELGAELSLVDRPGTDLAPLVESLRSISAVKVRVYYCDLEQDDQRHDFLNSIERENHSLSVLVNNAAFVGSSELKGWSVALEHQGIDTWRRALEVNLTAPFHLSQRLAPLLRRSPGPTIINIGSIYGQLGPDWRLYENTAMANPAAYAASKGGLLQLTRWLATTLAPDVRVNTISPGGIFRNQPACFVERYENRTPLGRMATEDDFRGVTAFLASDLSAYVTGQILSVDGGWGAW